MAAPLLTFIQFNRVYCICCHRCSCCYCEPMTEASERRCCASIRQVLHVCESASAACVTQLPAFRVNCLNLSVIQLAFYEQHEKTLPQLSKPIHESVHPTLSLPPVCIFLLLYFTLLVFFGMPSVCQTNSFDAVGLAAGRASGM